MNSHDAQEFVPDAPQPLVREIPDGQPYPVTALGPLISAVNAVQGTTQAPVAIPAASALAVASLAVQGFANVETLGGTRPTSLYVLTIAKSGERKSSCDNAFMEAVTNFERCQAKQRQTELLAWLNDHAIWKGERDRILGDVKRQKGENKTAAKADLEALGAEPLSPPSTDRTVTEPTYEGLTRLFVEGQPSIGLFSDEGGQFLGGHAMNTENRQKSLAAFNNLWQGSPIRRTRQGDGSYTLFGRRLAVHLMVQPIVAHTFIADPMAVETGFLARFLICEPPSTIGTRFHANTKRNVSHLDDFSARLTEILETDMPVNPETSELHPRTVRLSPAARNALVKFSDEVEQQQLPDGEFATITSVASKAAEQAARIAGVISLWEDLSCEDVTGETMANAISLAKFYLSEALRLESASSLSRGVESAEKLRNWLLQTWKHSEVTFREMLQHAPSCCRNAPELEKAINLLVEYGWLTPLTPGTEIRGSKRKRAWNITSQQ